MRPKVKLLVTVWGERHIERFSALALPSLLAPGNLPALAIGSDLEVLIMTSAKDRLLIENNPAFMLLREVCAVRFVPIDDLITSAVYGVTLTLAYARGIISCSDDALKTYFVFMNADFIVADGSLRNLLRHIFAGRAVILAPSFRAVTENVQSRLLNALDGKRSVLSISSRELVGIALDHPHPTNVAKTVNQGFYHATHPNQFFWWVDERTIVGRQYLMFMLCLRPERVMVKVNSYCDYGFVPAMCPSGDIVVMGDSDDIFMLELEPRRSERYLLRLGGQSIAEVARSLSEWTTIGHRQIARYDVVIHAGDLPPTTQRVKAEADRFISQVEGRLTKPIPYRHHPYWVSGVAAWRQHRRQQSLSDSVREIDDAIPFVTLWRYIWRTKIPNLGKSLLLGMPPFVRPWHYDWCDYREVRGRLVQILRSTDAKVLFISNGICPFDPLLPARDQRIERVNLRDALKRRYGRGWGSSPHVKFSHCFCYLEPKHLRYVRPLLEWMSPYLSQGGEIMIFVANLTDDYRKFSNELMDSVGFVLPSWRYTISVSFAGGVLNHFVRRGVEVLVSSPYNNGLKIFLITGPAIGFLLALSAFNNLYSVWSSRWSLRVAWCSSLLIRITDKSHVLDS